MSEKTKQIMRRPLSLDECRAYVSAARDAGLIQRGKVYRIGRFRPETGVISFVSKPECVSKK